MNESPKVEWSGSIDLERYEILCSLGVGSHGQVYKARDRDSGDLVAIKHVKRIASPASTGLNEFSAILAVKHPCIVPCFDFHYLPNGDTFLIYQYIGGGTLRDLLTPGQTVEGPVWRSCALAMLDALAHLHQNHLLHCDMKPENILMVKDEKEGTPRFLLSDLGVCRFLNANSNLEFSATPAGAPGYMAPESFYHQYSPASDLYGLGVILFEMACGQLPFEGDVREIARGHLQKEPPYDCVKDATRAEFIRWLLHKSPAARPASADLAARRLQGMDAECGNVADSGNLQRVPPLPPLYGMDAYNYQADFSINLFSRALIPLDFLGKPALASFQDSHFELFDALNGKALNRFIPCLSGILQFSRNGSVLTAEPRRLVLWEDDFRLPSTVVETDGRSEAAALDAMQSTAAWIRGEHLFIKVLQAHAPTASMPCPSAGLRPRIFATAELGRFIIITGCTRPEAIWVDADANVLASRNLPGPVVEASHTIHPALFCVSSLQTGSSNLVLVEFGQPGIITLTRFDSMPRCHSFCEDGVVVGEENGAVSIYSNHGCKKPLGVLDDPSSIILVSPRREFFLTVHQTGHRRRFQLFQMP